MARFGSSDGSGKPGDDPTRSTHYGQRGPQPPGPQPAPFGPPGPGQGPGGPAYNPGNAPTQYAAYGPFEQQAAADPDTAEFAAVPPTPWFRRRSVLIAWFGLIVVMLALVVWGIIQLTSRGPGEGGTAPGTSSSSTTSTTTSSTTSSTSSSESASSTSAPPAAPPGQAPQQPPTRQAPAPSETHHHHPRLPSLPSVITIPPVPRVPELPTVITLPPHR